MQSLAKKLLNMIGWKVVGNYPDVKKFILIVAPHTSNWDFVIGIIARFAMGRKVYFLAKHQLFNPLSGWFFKSLGGFPVHRGKKHDLVEQVVSEFQQHDEFILGITPEGTRSPVTRWKTGFYHIACKAEVPIVMVGFDYQKKEMAIQQPVYPSGDIEKDFSKITAYFSTVKGRYPKTIPEYQPPVS